MKKITALFLTAVLLMSLCACNSNPYKNDTQEDFSQKLDSGEYGTIVGVYSGKGNDDITDDEICVHLDSAQEGADYYSPDGLMVQFVNGKHIYDENDQEIDESELRIGDSIVVYYNLKIYGKNPVTVKAFRVEKLKVAQAMQS